MSDIPTSETDEPDDESATTDSTSTRHPYTNDGLAILLVAATVGLAVAYAVGVAGAVEIPLPVTTVLSLSTLAAVAWAFGPEMIAEAAKAWRGGKGGGQ